MPHTPAAQYLRMSTEHQRYSLDNQAAAIAAYAARRGYSVVRTYSDAGVSGLGFRHRKALRQLMADVSAGSAEFDAILVFDISRWGRFQDPDQSAHYEFLCREAGYQVEYCGEPFDNDGSMLSTVFKSLKRVMAAEYSRELSTKVESAMVRLAAEGAWMGGPPGYALRRAVVGGKRDGRILETGDLKRPGERVVIVPGPLHEQQVVRDLYRRFVEDAPRLCELAADLNARSIPSAYGRPWAVAPVRRILKNELYVGDYVVRRYGFGVGRENRRLLPPEAWIRVEKALPPIVERQVFEAAQKQFMQRGGARLTDEQLLARLRDYLDAGGVRSESVLERVGGMPSGATYRKHFGSMRTAFAIVGRPAPRGLRRRLAEDYAVRLDELFGRQLTDPRIRTSTIWRTLVQEGYPGGYHSVLEYSYVWRTARIGAAGKRRVLRGLSDEQLLDRLRELKARKGRLTSDLILRDSQTPNPSAYYKRFGGLLKAYELIGHEPEPRAWRLLRWMAAQRESATGPSAPAAHCV